MQTLLTSSDGAQQLQMVLAMADPNAFPTVDRVEQACGPKFTGTMDDFLAANGGGEALAQQLKNKVKKCAKCQKPNAFTLSSCNACGSDLSKVDFSFTPNIFTAFIYGVEKGPFPFKISIRSESSTLLAFDDLLSLSPCHVNTIPTDVYIPDFRALFEHPTEGLSLVRLLFETSWGVARDQFLRNAAWRSKMLRDSADLTDAELRTMTTAGFNYPPSQYQLHLQFMMAFFTPFHYSMFQRGNHFTRGRFFPIEYVIQCLELGVPLAGAADMELQDITAFFKQRGVDYDQMLTDCQERFGRNHKRLANWQPADFGGAIIDEKLVVDSNMQPLDKSVADVQSKDKDILQNYGRPYVDGKPSGTYYRFAKDPLLPDWNTYVRRQRGEPAQDGAAAAGKP